jgi:hypothetical protein
MICARLRASLALLSAAPSRRSEIVRANYNMPLVTLRDREER